MATPPGCITGSKGLGPEVWDTVDADFAEGVIC